MKGSFFFRDVTVAGGIIDLTAAHAGDLVDDLESWPEGENRLILDGFTYDRITGSAPTDATRRLPVWKGEFFPQPYQQLARVLREMGHEHDAKAVQIVRYWKTAAFERKRRQAAAWNKPWAWLLNQVNLVWNLLLRGLTGYGYRPLRSLGALGALFLAATALAHVAWEEGSMAPNSGVLLNSEGWRAYAEAPDLANPAAAWSAADGPGRDWESFNRYAYAADVVIPIIAFGQTDAWAPSTTRGPWGERLWWARWWLSALGWVAAALGAAAVSGIIRKD
ncbi:MAG: hypothetical protein GVY27_00635 [Deinococcus-Thermus bacterium]|nr:hypothetical protein [Deinococcota bacterium]